MADEWRIWDGTKWISPCECNIFLRTTTNSWFKVDPQNCLTRYWDGNHWCPITCLCVCEPPYIYDEDTGLCTLGGDCVSVLSFAAFTSFAIGSTVYDDINKLPQLFTVPGINSFTPSVASGSLGSGMVVQTTVDSAQQLIEAKITTPGTGYVNNEVLKPAGGLGFPGSFSFIYKTEPPPCPTITFTKVDNNKNTSEYGFKLYPNITSLVKPVTGAAYCDNTFQYGQNYTFKQGPSGAVIQKNLSNCTVNGITIPNGGTGANVLQTNFFNSFPNVFYDSTGGFGGVNGRSHKGAIWTLPQPTNTQCSFVHCLFVPGSVLNTQVFFIAINVISAVDVYIDNVLSIRFTDQVDASSHYITHVFPITLTGGLHQIRVKATSTITWQFRFIFMDIYTMGVLGWPTALSPGGYATDIAKFVGEIMTIGALPQTVELPQYGQLNPYLVWSTKELQGQTMIDPMPPLPYGQPLFSCPDGTTTPLFCGEDIICDSYPCEGELIDEYTEINFWVDTSGSMGSTYNALYDFFINTWKPCLILNVYGTLALFNERVRFWGLDGSNPLSIPLVPNIDERPVKGLATPRNFFRTVDTSVNRVLNMTWADESDVYGYGLNQQTTFNPSAACNAQWIADVTALRALFTAAPLGATPYDVKAINFTVHSDQGGIPYPTFLNGNLLGGCPSYQTLMIALGINNGNYNQLQPSAVFPAPQANPSNVSDYYMLQSGCAFSNVQSVMGAQANWYYDSLIHQGFDALNIFIPYC
jgi:hypothetical protein